MKNLVLKFAWRRFNLRDVSNALNVSGKEGRSSTASMPDASRRRKKVNEPSDDI